MKSVGEVMGIGRSFQEALHKATQSLEIKEMEELTEKDTPIMNKL
jgi:carbamoylphosphate synthase large subunit